MMKILTLLRLLNRHAPALAMHLGLSDWRLQEVHGVGH
jgi:hypothetical protein